jgi:hypothetical protein
MYLDAWGYDPDSFLRERAEWQKTAGVFLMSQKLVFLKESKRLIGRGHLQLVKHYFLLRTKEPLSEKPASGT